MRLDLFAACLVAVVAASPALAAPSGQAVGLKANQVGEILHGPDMLTADAFAEMIGATRETVHKKRHRHEVLGLEGPKRGVRFPNWQVSSSGEFLPGLPQLFEALGDRPWTVYRFLLQDHPELGGARGLDALRAGHVESAISAAKAIGEGSFS